MRTISTVAKINQYSGSSVNPLNYPDTTYELYSVPSFDSQYPEIIKGLEIGSTKITVEPGDVLICKINPRINRVWVVEHHTEHQLLASSEWIVVRNPNMDSNYLKWYFSSPSFRNLITSQVAGIGGSLTRAQPKQVAQYPVPIVPYDEQAEIAANLTLVDDLISLQRQQISKIDELVKSRFIELFGDPMDNPNNLQSFELEGLSDIVAGITKGRKTHGEHLYSVPYMAVSNVKAGYIDWTTIKTIDATQAEIEQYRLQPYDVLMTEGGDPDKLGRGAMIIDPPDNCIHQNHIFRVRVNRDVLLPQYLEAYLQHPKAKQYFFRCAKQTTGIASINMKQLRALPVLLPSIDLQNEFAAFVEHSDKLKLEVKQSLEKLETLKKSLMQEYFG